MSNYTFGTKAEVLEYLYNNRDKIGAIVLRPFFCNVKEWNNAREDEYAQIENTFTSCTKLIVRSSAISEDSTTQSLAGAYESIICDNNKDSICDAVDKVIASYGCAQDDDQILIQEAIEDIDCAGVAFSVDPNTGGQYYVINYDDITGSSSSVTSGNGEETNLFYWFSGSPGYPTDDRMGNVCRVISELKELTGREALDIEFLFSKGQLYILQARPLIVRIEIIDKTKQGNVLNQIYNKINHENREKPYISGRKTLYGVMPDWNPAEMIGIHPKNLAMSLYKEIITDEVWAYQRDNYGYRRLRSFPLMIDFCGYPYIDVRVSFNSFIPADLDEDIADKLVNYYIDRLEESPEKHDKVEFDVVFTCYTFDLPKRIQVLSKYGFTQKEIDEITNSLRNVTKKITNNETGLWRQDAGKIKILEERRQKLEDSSLSNIDKAFWLLEDCKRYGTLPFAGLARAGFIAVQLLKSMVVEGIITHEENDAFMSNLTTVGSMMKMDYNTMGKGTFLNKYGFLRPGTYDICSKRYDEAPNTYFRWEERDTVNRASAESPKFRLSLEQMDRIKRILVEHGLGDDVLGLFSFIKGAIEGRERAKFIFTRNVSDVLKLIGEWGDELGFARDDLSYSDISIVSKLYSGADNPSEILEKSIQEGKSKYYKGLGIVLPPLIVDEEQVFEFTVPNSQPNYITQNRIEAEVCTNIMEEGIDLTGKILLIESADPGYDWIFSHQIGGFVTKYGGANSHMAIRAGELSIPAVVGAGKLLFDNVSKAEIVEIDAANKTTRVIR